MDSCEVLREGGPTKRVGAGRRFGFVEEVCDVLGLESFGEDIVALLVVTFGENW